MDIPPIRRPAQDPLDFLNDRPAVKYGSRRDWLWVIPVMVAAIATLILIIIVFGQHPGLPKDIRDDIRKQQPPDGKAYYEIETWDYISNDTIAVRLTFHYPPVLDGYYNNMGGRNGTLRNSSMVQFWYLRNGRWKTGRDAEPKEPSVPKSQAPLSTPKPEMPRYSG